MKSVASSLTATPSQPSLKGSGFAYYQASLLGHTRPTVCSTYPSVSPLRSNDFRWYRNINLLSIAYAFRPRLRPRLTTNPERTNLPQETLDFRRTGFSPALRYSCQHSLFCTVHQVSRLSFCPYRMLLYQFIEFLSFGNRFQPRLSSAQSHSTSELLRTL